MDSDISVLGRTRNQNKYLKNATERQAMAPKIKKLIKN